MEPRLLVAYHGYWNRIVPTDYKRVRFKLDSADNYLGVDNFITGWLTPSGALGCPVDILIKPDKIIYISDDKAGVFYRAWSPNVMTWLHRRDICAAVTSEGVFVMRKNFRLLLILITVMAVLLPLSAHAAVVGHFTMVRGRVDLLKGGKLPAIPVKVKDGVEPGDIIRTKARAKAELTMVDGSVIVLAPESRLAVADYVYNPARGERRAVLRFFRGLVHAVVSRVVRTEQPDFIMETHTATVGVRGTDWYTLLAPSFTSVYLVQGLLGVRSNVPTIPALLLLKSMQFTQIPLGKQPFLARPITPEMVRILQKLMDKGVRAGGLLGPGGPSPPGGGEMQLPYGLPTSPEQRIRREYIPPVLKPQPQMPAPAPSPSPHSPGLE
jgi:hypothetical protein